MPSIKFIYSMTKNDKVYNWSQEKHAITLYIDFKHIKRRDNILADSLSRLKTLGLYEASDPEEPSSKYGKSIFDTESRHMYVMSMLVNTQGI